jgi:hypothetical protein
MEPTPTEAQVAPTKDEFCQAAMLAELHGLTLFGAAYAAVASARKAELATLDNERASRQVVRAVIATRGATRPEDDTPSSRVRFCAGHRHGESRGDCVRSRRVAP